MKKWPFELSATPATSPKFTSAGSLRTSITESKGISGAAVCCCGACAAAATVQQIAPATTRDASCDFCPLPSAFCLLPSAFCLLPSALLISSPPLPTPPLALHPPSPPAGHGPSDDPLACCRRARPAARRSSPCSAPCSSTRPNLACESPSRRAAYTIPSHSPQPSSARPRPCRVQAP